MTNIARVAFLCAVILSIGLTWECEAQASGLQVSPVLVEFSPTEQAQAIWLSNTGASPLRAQLRIRTWNQEDNQDVLMPAQDLVASPPIVQVPAGGRQLVRLIRSMPVASAQEMSYRVLVDELPDETQVTEGSASHGLQFLLRYSIPIFVKATDTANHASEKHHGGTETASETSQISAQWKDETSRNFHSSILSIRNDSTTRLKISQLIFISSTNQRTVLAAGLFGYVLAGKSISWSFHDLPPALSVENGTFQARFNDDVRAQTLPVVYDGR